VSKQAGTAALLWVIVTVAGLCPIRLEAHQINLSNAHIELKPDRTVSVEIALKGSDVDRVARTSVFDQQSDLVDAARLAASTSAIAAYLTTHAAVQGADGAPCKAGAVEIAPDQDGVIARLNWSCRVDRVPVRMIVKIRQRHLVAQAFQYRFKLRRWRVCGLAADVQVNIMAKYRNVRHKGQNDGSGRESGVIQPGSGPRTLDPQW
jgi:hypothetical protein